MDTMERVVILAALSIMKTSLQLQNYIQKRRRKSIGWLAFLFIHIRFAKYLHAKLLLATHFYKLNTYLQSEMHWHETIICIFT